MRVKHRAVKDDKPGHVVDVTDAFYEHEGIAMHSRLYGTHSENEVKMILAGRRARAKQVSQTLS